MVVEGGNSYFLKCIMYTLKCRLVLVLVMTSYLQKEIAPKYQYLNMIEVYASYYKLLSGSPFPLIAE